MRRVILLPATLARAEPRAVEASRLEARDTVDGVWATPAGIVASEALAVGEPCAAGEPQTSQ
jgi:hypothetical protein